MAHDSLLVKRVPLASLHLDPSNARTHGPENLEAIVGSLKQFGQAEPLVVQAKTGRVIGGNGRLVAMKQLGWTECDVVELDLSDLQATALGIALNRSASLASWDDPTLAKLLQELQAEDALDGVGYTPADIDQLLEELNAGLSPTDLDDPGPEEPPETPVTRPGDLWLLGNQKLLCGDSTKAEDIARVMAGDKAVLLSTDPPYCVDYTGDNRPIHEGKRSGKDWSHVYREVDIADLGTFMDSVLRAVLPNCIETAPIYLWHAHVQQHVISQVFERFDILFHQVIVWVKPTGVFGHSFYQWRHEPCAFGWRRGHKPDHGHGQLNTVWEADWEGKQRTTTFHPTSKPTRLFEVPMEQHTKPGAIVLEPFCGSGSQLIAAEKLGRRCRAVELQPAFVDGALLRWEKATGKQAVLDGAGKTFAQVATDRLGAGPRQGG